MSSGCIEPEVGSVRQVTGQAGPFNHPAGLFPFLIKADLPFSG
jgi:hypothetical protein